MELHFKSVTLDFRSRKGRSLEKHKRSSRRFLKILQDAPREYLINETDEYQNKKTSIIDSSLCGHWGPQCCTPTCYSNVVK